MSEKKETFDDLINFIVSAVSDYTSPEPHRYDARFSKSIVNQDWRTSAQFELLQHTATGAAIEKLFSEERETKEGHKLGLNMATLEYFKRAKGPVEFIVDKTPVSREFFTFLSWALENKEITTVNGIPREELRKLYPDMVIRDLDTYERVKDILVESLRVGKLSEEAPPRPKLPQEDLLAEVERRVRELYGPRVDALAFERARCNQAHLELGMESAARESATSGLSRFLPTKLIKHLRDQYREGQRSTTLRFNLFDILSREQKLTQEILRDDNVKAIMMSTKNNGQELKAVFGEHAEQLVVARIKETLAKLQSESAYRHAKQSLNNTPIKP